jgi:hypothetical protein
MDGETRTGWLLWYSNPRVRQGGSDTVCKSKEINEIHARSQSQRTNDRTERREREEGAEDSETSVEE